MVNGTHVTAVSLCPRARPMGRVRKFSVLWSSTWGDRGEIWLAKNTLSGSVHQGMYPEASRRVATWGLPWRMVRFLWDLVGTPIRRARWSSDQWPHCGTSTFVLRKLSMDYESSGAIKPHRHANLLHWKASLLPLPPGGHVQSRWKGCWFALSLKFLCKTSK